VLAVAGLTIAAGGDNLGVYVPLLRRTEPALWPLYPVVFAGGVAVWCGLAVLLAGRRPVIAALERTGRWLVPVLFIGIGLGILTGLK